MSRRDPNIGTALIIGNYLPSLAAARSLAAAGYRVMAGDGGEYSTVRWSRHCHEVWRHPPARRGDDLITALSSLIQRRPDISVIFPLRPDYVEFLAANRRLLPRGPIVASPEPEVVLTCLDKHRMVQVAREAGIPQGAILTARDLGELAAACEEVGFPCVIRPTGDTRDRLPGNRKAIVCQASGEVPRFLPAWPSGHGGLLVQRYVAGRRHNVYFAAQAGRIIGRVETQILRTDKVDGTGLAVEGVTVAPDPRLDRYCRALVERLSYTGVGTAQFQVPPVGEPHLIELNPRHGGMYALVERCGLELTQAAIGLASGAIQASSGMLREYPVGMRYVWSSRDVYGLATALSRSEIGPRGALRWLALALRAAVQGRYHLTWSWTDPLPTLVVYAHLLTLGPWRQARA